MMRRRLNFSLWILLAPLAITGCDTSRPSPESESQLEGIGSILKGTPIPPAKSAQSIAEFSRLLRSEMLTKVSSGAVHTSGKSALTAAIVPTIIKAGGMPRSQLTRVLKDLMADDKAVCGGAACGRVFGISANEVDGYLDELAGNLAKLETKLSAKDMNLLAGSLKSDHVTFSNAFIQTQIRRQLGVHDRPLTHADLVNLKTLEVREGRLSPTALNDKDLALISHVTLDLRYRNPEWLEDALMRSRKMSNVSIKHIETHHSLEFNRSVELDRLEFLHQATHIRSLTIVALNFDLTRSFKALPPSLKHLEISQVNGRLSDEKVALLNQVPSLNSISLKMEFSKITASDNVALGANVRSVKFYEKSGEAAPCANLAKLGIFRHAAFMTIGGCTIDGLNPPQPYAWEALYLAKPSKAGAGLRGKVQVSSNLSKLKIVKAEDSTVIDLDAASRAVVDARARQSKDLQNGRIVEAILMAEPECAAARPSGGMVERILTCMRRK